VTFTNRSGYDVAFYLNGGAGIEATLADGKSATWTVVVDPGVEPFVRIHQVKGKSLEFSLQDGGRYVFRVEGGKIVNALE